MTASFAVALVFIGAIGAFVYHLATGRNPFEDAARWVGNKIADLWGGSPRW